MEDARTSASDGNAFHVKSRRSSQKKKKLEKWRKYAFPAQPIIPEYRRMKSPRGFTKDAFFKNF